MNRYRNQNIMLVEIMIAVLFFALCSTVVIQTFAAAREYVRSSSAETEAMTEMQNISECLYAADDFEAVLKDMGFAENGGVWSKKFDDFEIAVELDIEKTAAGELRLTKVKAVRNDAVIAEIPGARYMSGGAAK